MIRPFSLPQVRTLLSRDEATALIIGCVSIFVLSSLWFGQSLALYMLMVIVVGGAICLSPQAGLFAILVCTMIFERHFTLQELLINNTSYKIYPLDILIALLLLRIVFTHSISEIRSFFSTRTRYLDLPIFVFGALCLIAFVHGWWVQADMALAFSTLKNYFLYSVIYFFAVVLLRTETDWRDCMRWFSFGALVVFFFLVYGLVTGTGLWSEYTPLSTAGARLIAGTHIFYLTLFGFWVLSWYLFSRDSAQTNQDDEEHTQTLLVLLLAVLVGVLVSLVRHIWVALAVIALLYLYYLPKEGYRRIVSLAGRCLFVCCLCFSIFLLATSFVSGRLPSELYKTVFVLKERINVSSVVALEDSSFAWRVGAWRSGYELLARQPLFGIGFGQSVVLERGSGYYEIPMRDLHNDYLGILIQTGIVGIAIVLWWFGRVYRATTSRFMLMRRESVVHERLLWTAWSGFLLFVICFSISVYWDINLFIIFFWWLLAMMRFALERTQKGI